MSKQMLEDKQCDKCKQNLRPVGYNSIMTLNPYKITRIENYYCDTCKIKV